MTSWRKHLPRNPLPILLDSGVEPVAYFARRDLLGEDPGPVARLWDLPDAQKILRRQQKNGRWKYPSPATTDRTLEDYDQIETYRQVGFLVEKFGFTRRHPALRRAAEWLFTCQTEAGDFRGIYGRQYSPNYSAGIMELLIKGGYGRDARIARGLRWLLAMRQSDGGWSVPLRTAGVTRYTEVMARGKTLEPDRAKPSSHLATGVVLRAFALSARYRKTAAIQSAGRWLAGRIFRPDSYVDRRAVSFWTGFRYPFWFTDLITALDTLSRLGFPPDGENIRRGLGWFVERQRKDGGWTLKLLSGADKNLPLWLDLAVCRIFKRFYPD
jgi:squalene cyclase